MPSAAAAPASSDSRMLASAARVPPVTATLTSRRRDDRRLDPFCGISGQRSADAERLVVGMREQGHELERRHWSWELGAWSKLERPAEVNPPAVNRLPE